MKYKIQWQDRWGKWQHYQTKTNEADAFRVMKQMVKQKGIRHRICLLYTSDAADE